MRATRCKRHRRALLPSSQGRALRKELGMQTAPQHSGRLRRLAWMALLLAAHTGCQSAPHAHRSPYATDASLARLTAPLERAAGVGLSVANAATAIAIFP